MPNYYEGSIDDCDEPDVTWSVQEAISDTIVSNPSNGFLEFHQPKDPPGYRFMAEEGKEKRKKKKRRDREKETQHRKSQEGTRTEGVSVIKDLGYGFGLSRGFTLWRTLKDIRHCITKVSDPMTKAQRRSLRRKLSYYVDDMERIVVGVNPRAPESNSEDAFSGDEELREEVSALIEDALDEAALQGKIVQSDYFETRMSYLEQRFATLKKQLEEMTSEKSVQEEITCKKVQEQDKQEGNGPMERQTEEEDVRDGEKMLKRGQLQNCTMLKKQVEEVESKNFVQEEVTSKKVQEQDKQEANGPKKRQLEEEDVRDDDKVEERGKMQKRARLKNQLKEGVSKKLDQEDVTSKAVQEQDNQEANGPKKRQPEEEDVRNDEKMLGRGQMQKHAMLKKQLEEVASKKFVPVEVTSKNVQEQEANGPNKLQIEEEYFRSDDKVLGRGQIQKHLMLKKQLKSLASKKFVQAEVTSKKVLERKVNGPKKQQIDEEEVRDDDKVQERGQVEKHPSLKKQLKDVASKKDKQEANGPKTEEEDVRHDDTVQERGQMQKQQEDLQCVSKSSPTLHTSLCSLQAAVINQHSNEGSAESHIDEDVVKDRKRMSSIEEEQVKAELAKTLGQVDVLSKEGDEPVDQSRKILEEVTGDKPFRGFGGVGRPRGRGRGRGKVPSILKRISLNY